MVDPHANIVRMNGNFWKLKTGSKTFIDFGSANFNSPLGTGISFIVNWVITMNKGFNKDGAVRVTGCKQLEASLGGKGLKVLIVQGEEDSGVPCRPDGNMPNPPLCQIATLHCK